MAFGFLQRLMSASTALVPAQQPVQQAALQRVQAVQARQPGKQQLNNPFMLAMNDDTPQFMDMYGVNKPLKQPMFLGYRDEKPLYGGSRLFILY